MVALPLWNQWAVDLGSNLFYSEESKIASEREAGKNHQESAMQRTHELEAMKSPMAMNLDTGKFELQACKEQAEFHNDKAKEIHDTIWLNMVISERCFLE